MPTIRKPKAVGRPIQGAEAKRHVVSCRVTPEVMQKLDDAIAANGRSLAQEVEQRLERSIEQEVLRGGPSTNALISSILARIAEIEEETGARWDRDPVTFGAVEAAIVDEVADWLPVPEEFAERRRSVENKFAAVDAIRDATDATEAGVAGLNPAHLNNLQQGLLDHRREAMQSYKALEDDLRALTQPGRDLFQRLSERRRAARDLRSTNAGGSRGA